MFCIKCGKENKAGSTFCTGCGALLSSAGAQSSVQQMPVQQQTYASQCAYQPGGTMGAQPGCGGSMQQKQEGCFSAAWHDLTSTPNWIGKLLLLGLISLVLVLNFFAVGYLLLWARDLSFGKREGMPAHIFEGDSFKIGFFACVVSLAYTLCWYLATCLLAVIFGYMSASLLSYGSLYGTGTMLSAVGVTEVVMGLVYLFFVLPLECVSVMRMAVTNRLGAAFNMKEVFFAFKKSYGSLLMATILPCLVAAAIAIVFSVIVKIIVIVLAGASFASLGNGYGYQSVDSLVTSIFIQLGWVTCILFLLFLLLYIFITPFTFACVYRGTGHWAARIAPEWASEAMYTNAGGYNAYQQQPYNAASPYGATSVPGSVVAPAQTPVAAPAVAPASAPSAAVAPAAAPTPTSAPTPIPTPAVVPASTPVSSYPSTMANSDNSDTSLLSESDDSGTTLLGGAQADISNISAVILERSDGVNTRITSFPATVGKGSAANVVISGNSAISRTHVRISQVGDVIAVEDLGTTNGTTINGNLLAEGELVALNEGDKLGLGKEEFIVHIKR